MGVPPINVRTSYDAASAALAMIPGDRVVEPRPQRVKKQKVLLQLLVLPVVGVLCLLIFSVLHKLNIGLIVLTVFWSLGLVCFELDAHSAHHFARS
mmetsp:Transcript_47266/g.94195  ORF Transcript_47266/g.94195 Transcript_47266/m.94195 type:complete len:96 (-) Transcript_47266:873-1160(-)